MTATPTIAAIIVMVGCGVAHAQEYSKELAGVAGRDREITVAYGELIGTIQACGKRLSGSDLKLGLLSGEMALAGVVG